MNATDTVRNRIIDKLLGIFNKSFLDSIYQIIEHNPSASGNGKLTEAQIEMLKMSEDDYKEGRVILQEQLDKEDKEWLGGM